MGRRRWILLLQTPGSKLRPRALVPLQLQLLQDLGRPMTKRMTHLSAARP
jgi:hypothetical protein